MKLTTPLLAASLVANLALVAFVATQSSRSTDKLASAANASKTVFAANYFWTSTR